MLAAKNASSLSHATIVDSYERFCGGSRPLSNPRAGVKKTSSRHGSGLAQDRDSLLAHLVMVGYISLSRSASPKFSYTCHGLAIANPAQAGPPAPETVGAVLATRPSGPCTSAKSRAHLVKNAPAHHRRIQVGCQVGRFLRIQDFCDLTRGV